MKNLELVGLEEIINLFLEETENRLGCEGYNGFIVHTDGLEDGYLYFGLDYSSYNTFENSIYSYNLEDEDFDEDYVKLQIEKGLDYFIDRLG